MTLERIFKATAGHNCRDFRCRWGKDGCQPGAGGYHGLHGLTLWFYVKGDKGVVQASIYTGWIPTQVERDDLGTRIFDLSGGTPMPMDLGYHAREPQWEGQEVCRDSCWLLDGEPCYYDGSGLNAYDAGYTLVNGGSEELWKFLDGYYRHVFEGGEYPDVYEYPFERRSVK